MWTEAGDGRVHVATWVPDDPLTPPTKVYVSENHVL